MTILTISYIYHEQENVSKLLFRTQGQLINVYWLRSSLSLVLFWWNSIVPQREGTQRFWSPVYLDSNFSFAISSLCVLLESLFFSIALILPLLERGSFLWPIEDLGKGGSADGRLTLSRWHKWPASPGHSPCLIGSQSSQPAIILTSASSLQNYSNQR
jgi:hypothetical protein